MQPGSDGSFAYCIQDVLLSWWPSTKLKGYRVPCIAISSKLAIWFERSWHIIDSANFLSLLLRPMAIVHDFTTWSNDLLKCQAEWDHFSCLDHQMYLQSKGNDHNFIQQCEQYSDQRGRSPIRIVDIFINYGSFFFVYLTFLCFLFLQSPPSYPHVDMDREHVKSVRTPTHIDNLLWSVPQTGPVYILPSLHRPPSLQVKETVMSFSFARSYVSGDILISTRKESIATYTMSIRHGHC